MFISLPDSHLGLPVAFTDYVQGIIYWRNLNEQSEIKRAIHNMTSWDNGLQVYYHKFKLSVCCWLNSKLKKKNGVAGSKNGVASSTVTWIFNVGPLDQH